MKAEHENFQKQLDFMASELSGLKAENTVLKEQLEWFKRQMFGQKSERFVPLDPNQPTLDFGTALEEPEKPEEISVPAHKRKVSKGKSESSAISWPDDLPVEEEVIDVPEEERIDPVTGEELKIIGEEVSQKLGIRSGYFVKKIIRIKRANPKSPHDGVLCPPMPDCIIERSTFDVSFMAWVCIQKFVYHMPVYRIVEKLAANDIIVSKQTLCNLLKTLGERLLPLYYLMIDKIFESGIIYSDDTPVKLQQKKKCKEARIWAYVGGNPNAPPYHVYDFTTGREWRYVIDFLKEFKGIVHADAYQAYEKIDSDRDDVTWCACWAHARRYFENSTAGDRRFRDEILELMGKLFELERDAWEKTEEERHEIRQKHELPLVNELFEKLKEKVKAYDLLPKSKLAKAIGYMLSREQNFRNYLDHPNARMENNTAERALRKTVIGRKNWLFIGSEDAGKSAAALFSILQTCRATGVKPQEYLENIFRRLMSHPSGQLEELLPDKWTEAKQH
jgi:transposase